MTSFTRSTVASSLVPATPSWILYFFTKLFAKLHNLYQDLLLTIRINYGLYQDPTNRVPVLYHALRRHTGASVACCYMLRGRLYLCKQPSQIQRVLTSKQNFEKLKCPKHSPLAVVLGKAITTSGDDPVAWLAAKRTMRSGLHISRLIPAFHLMSQRLVDHIRDNWTTNKANGVKLYHDALAPAIVASYQTFFGMDLPTELAKRKRYTLEEYVRLVDMYSNTGVAAASQSQQDIHLFASFTQELTRDCLRQAPTGCFGAAIQQMIQDTTEHNHFTQDMGIGNALFYVHAIPVMTCIVIHWTVRTLTTTSNSTHLERIRSELDQGDRTYLRMCLKEVLRLYHPAAFMARRAKQNVQLDDTAIPKGSLVLPFAKLLPDLDLNFQPHRWKDRDLLVDEVVDDDNGIFYAPFAFGARSCLGKTLVADIFEDTMASLLQKFSFEALSSESGQNLGGKTTLSKIAEPPALQHVPDMMIGFKPRSEHLYRVQERICQHRNIIKELPIPLIGLNTHKTEQINFQVKRPSHLYQRTRTKSRSLSPKLWDHRTGRQQK